MLGCTLLVTIYMYIKSIDYWYGCGTVKLCYSAVTYGGYYFKQTTLNCINNSGKCAQA